jgi:hypothetical protein
MEEFTERELVLMEVAFSNGLLEGAYQMAGEVEDPYKVFLRWLELHKEDLLKLDPTSTQ